MCPLLPGGAAARSARCAGPARRRRAAAPPQGRLPAGASGRKRSGTPAARRSPHRSSAAGHPRCRVLRPGGDGGPTGSGLRSRGRPVREPGSTDALLRPPCQVRLPPGRRRRPSTWGRWPRERKKRKSHTSGPTRAARCAVRGVCHGRVSPACRRIIRLLEKSGFQGLFTRTPEIASDGIGKPVTAPVGESRQHPAEVGVDTRHIQVHVRYFER
jgi:hypothetical protein